MIGAVLSLISCFVILACWGIFLTFRSIDRPEWFKRFSDTKVGTAVIFIAGLVMIFSIFFSFSPDAFWN